MLGRRYKLAVVGIGRQSRKYMSTIPLTDNLILDSVVDIDHNALEPFKGDNSLGKFSNVDELIAQRKPEIALVCVTHSDHFEIVTKLAKAGVHVIKEKPFALSTEEAKAYEKLSRETGIKIFTAVKRRFDPVYGAFPALFRPRIGRVFYFEGKYGKNVEDLGEGWRAKFDKAGGGALIDMGYHYVDLMVWYFGRPKSFSADFGFNNRDRQVYDVEDTVALQMAFDHPGPQSGKIIGQITVSRIMPVEQENLMIVGTDGCVIINNGIANLYDRAGKVVSSIQNDKVFNENKAMLDYFAEQISTDADPDSHMPQVEIIESAYGMIKDNVPMAKLIRARRQKAGGR